MSLRNRIVVIVSLLLLGTVLAVSSVLAWSAYNALYDQQEDDGLAMARLLARTAGIVENFPQEMEDAIGEQMVVEATIAAHLVALGEQAGLTPEEINARLDDIVTHTALNEFWITDATGTVVYQNIDVPFAFTPDPVTQPQAYVFWALLTGEKNFIIQESRQRELDNQTFKYVGVQGVDGPRIVQVGYNVSFLDEYRERVSLYRLVAALVAAGDVTAIRVTDADNNTTLIYSGIPDLESAALTETDHQNLALVLEQGIESFYREDSWFKVIVPIYTGTYNQKVTGATIVYLPTDRLDAILFQQAIRSGAVAAIVLSLGVLISLWLSRRVMGPVSQVSRAALAVEAGEYKAGMLAAVTSRTDEMGQLGRVFEEMAGEVLARDRRLRLLRVVIPIGVSLSAERDFNRLLETIVVEAQSITGADAGSLYLLTEDKILRFVIVRNTSLGMAFGGTTGKPVDFAPLPLYVNGQPDHAHIATHVALTGERAHVEDAYLPTAGYDFSGTRAFDQRTGYHSKSFLAIPLEGQDGKVIGVLQLINASDPKTGDIVAFATDDVLESLVLMASAALAGYIREESLRNEISKLRIEIDQTKKTQQVAEITDSDYFQTLQAQADVLKEQRRRRKK